MILPILVEIIPGRSRGPRRHSLNVHLMGDDLQHDDFHGAESEQEEEEDHLGPSMLGRVHGKLTLLFHPGFYAALRELGKALQPRHLDNLIITEY